ncbi:hypothetical protein ACO0SA_003374 [Hanseniaspora valbyensis]
MSHNNHHSSNLTFSKEITSLLTSLNETPNSDNIKCLDEYIINYLDDISGKLYELYNFKSETSHNSILGEGSTKKKPKRKIKIDDLKFIFRNDSEKLSRLTELSDLATQRDILQKQINAPENFSMLGSYGDGAGETVSTSKSGAITKNNKRKLGGSDDDEAEEDLDLFDDEDDDEIENYTKKIESPEKTDKDNTKTGKNTNTKVGTKKNTVKKAKVNGTKN